MISEFHVYSGTGSPNSCPRSLQICATGADQAGRNEKRSEAVFWPIVPPSSNQMWEWLVYETVRYTCVYTYIYYISYHIISYHMIYMILILIYIYILI